MFRIRLQFLGLLFCCALFVSLPLSAAKSDRNLSEPYRHWIDVEVPYIISHTERKQFLSLQTDAERDSFIEAFWRVRNPDPQSEINSFKEEHYRRLAYANQHFGDPRYENGWRTEMGRIYIILGAPKQRATYYERANVRPMEIWFYQSDTPALPPYFNILFFKHSAAESWRIYSPTQDGPAALVTTGESQNDNRMALRFIRKSLGDEVATTTCTLFPDQHCDFDNFAPSMESDMMLATINDLPDNALTRQKLEANRLREHVTTSVFVGDQGMTLGYQVVRDDKGRETLSYVLQQSQADPRLIGRRPDGTAYYDATLRTVVATSDGKLAYEQDDQLTGKLTDPQVEIANKKRFAAEARLPLAPGNYLLDVTLTNNINHVASRKHFNVTVPEAKTDTIGISPLLAYAAPAAVPDPQGRLPFSISKLRFTPRSAQAMEIRQGNQLPLVFQLWINPGATGPDRSGKVHLRYVFGAVTASQQKPLEEQEEVDASNIDAAGNLLTGHKLDTSTLEPGTYRVVVSATRDGDHRTAYAAASLKVIRPSEFLDTWTAYGASDSEGDAVDDLKRGLSAEAAGVNSAAVASYTQAMVEAPKDPRPVEHLAALFARRGDSDELARLGQQPVLMQTAASPKLLLSIADALRKQGNPKQVVRLLDAQIKLQPPSAELYHALADACEASGDSGRARDLRTLAAGLK